MKRIDPSQGPRAALYRHFRGFVRPHFTLCAKVDFSSTLQRARDEGSGTFAALLRQVMCAANAVPELRQRVRVESGQDLVVEHERVHATCTVARPDESFQFCFFPHLAERADFLRQVGPWAAAAASSTGLDLGEQGRDDMLYLTCIPWLDFTTIQHAEAAHDPLDCVPRIAWGRLVEGQATVCLTSHHALVDGRHASRFFEALARPDLEP